MNDSSPLVSHRRGRPKGGLGLIRVAAIVGLLCGVFPVSVWGQALDRSRPPELAPLPPLKLPKVHRQKLPTGWEIVVLEMHETPVVDVTLLLRAGSVRDPADRPGIATFTANMLDEGAGQRNALEIAEEADYLGASLTAGAGWEAAQVSLHVPKRRLAPALDLMADVVLRPAFPDSEIVRQRDLRRTAILQLRDQPTSIAPLAFNAILFGARHPYGRPQGGNEASTDSLNREQVKKFYDTYYRPNGARLLLVGDITADESRKLVSDRFGSWKRGSMPALPVLPAPAPSSRTIYLVDKPGAAQSVIRIGHVGVARSTPDYYALQVLNTILGGSFTSRLNQNLRETHGYTYGASSAFEMRRLAGPFRATASVVTAKTDSSLIEFMRELRGIRDRPVSRDEIEKAKAYITLGLPSQFETTAGAAAQFVDLLANNLPLDYYDRFGAKINAVTVADVQRVAKKYLNPDQFAVVVVGDRSQIEPRIRALNEGPIQLRDLWGQEVR
jgi:zinc protease